MALSAHKKEWMGLFFAICLVMTLAIFGWLGWQKVSGDDSITHVTIAKIVAIEKINAGLGAPTSYKITYDLHGTMISNYFTDDWYETHKTRKHFLVTYRMSNGYHIDSIR
ncbi:MULTISPECIES: hypothetical protein [unclassified Gluconobacter]|uniref:hypothetical protein n=1 Tax=unclassified Gluconobacter TaxID=2644261 RepID=UPI001C05A0EA|nr:MULTISPECIES: hypothetical protein [unclassified Gluconobacter]